MMKANTRHSRSSRSLTQILSFALISLSVVALVTVGLFTIYNNFSKQQANIIEQQQRIAQGANETVSGFFEEKYKALEATIKIVELSKGSTKEKELVLASLLATQPAFRQIVLLDTSARSVAQASHISLTLSDQFTNHIQEATSPLKSPGGRYISSLYFDDQTREPLIVLAVPTDLWDFKGTLAIEVNLQFMWTLVDQQKVGQTGYVYIVDNQGYLMAAKDTERVLARENVKQISEVKEFVENPSAEADLTPDVNSYTGLLGEKVVGTYVPLRQPQWAVLTEIPYSEVYQPIFQSVALSLAAIAVMTFLAGTAGSLIARRLAIPLVNLTKMATRIADGEHQLRAPESGAREIASLATAFNTMTSQLQGLIDNLEDRVTSRTSELESANKQISHRAAQLQAITELSEVIAHLQDLGDIFPTTTLLINERFGFYHVGIFLVDGNHEFAILQAANSEGGQRMLARGHRLKLGTGVVGFAAQSGQPRIALDVGADAVFFDNPDLPATRSEVALPLKSHDDTIGVLDVQSTEPGAFSQDDLQVLTTLANQVSIALENARLLSETRTALKQVQEVYDEFTRAEWSRTVAQAEQPGFRYQAGRIEMLEKGIPAPEVTSAVKNRESATSEISSEKRPSVAVPVKLRGEVVGVLHIESNDPGRTWHEDDITLVEAVAERAAFAMENARLFQEARRRAAKESLISEATARISGALNIENILQTTAEELERVLGGSEVLIQFQSKDS
jgi:GAF domain-containing protein/HAMP domain-containing protein